MKSIVAGFLLLIARPTAAMARLDGNTLLARCSAQDVKDCSVYLDGFADALRESPGDARPATCTAERAGRLGCSGVPKNCV